MLHESHLRLTNLTVETRFHRCSIHILTLYRSCAAPVVDKDYRREPMDDSFYYSFLLSMGSLLPLVRFLKFNYFGTSDDSIR